MGPVAKKQVVWRGVTNTVPGWAKARNIPTTVLRTRLRLCETHPHLWNIDRAMTEPPAKKAKIDRNTALSMRASMASGTNPAVLAAAHKLTKQYVYRLGQGRYWKE